MKKILIAALALLLLSGCSGNGPGTGTAVNELYAPAAGSDIPTSDTNSVWTKDELPVSVDYSRMWEYSESAQTDDPAIPSTIDEWLDQFEMFSIYEILPEILELWGSNLFTDVSAKKTAQLRTGTDNAAVYAPVRGGRDQYCRSRPSHHRINTGHVD